MALPVLMLTGPSGAGKSTLASAVQVELASRGVTSSVIDGDALRAMFADDLPHGSSGQKTNLERAICMAETRLQHGEVPILAFVSPDATLRAFTRDACEGFSVQLGRTIVFLEIYVTTPIDVCAARDVKGLYGKLASDPACGVLLAGVNDKYDVPVAPALVCRTDEASIDECTAMIVTATLTAMEGDRT